MVAKGHKAIVDGWLMFEEACKEAGPGDSWSHKVMSTLTPPTNTDSCEPNQAMSSQGTITSTIPLPSEGQGKATGPRGASGYQG